MLGGKRLKAQKSKVEKIQSDIDKTHSDINRHKVQIGTGQKMMKKLTKGIEDSEKEKERLVEEVDTDFKLKDMKRANKELEMKGKDYEKKLDQLQTALRKHMKQLQVDLMDPEKMITMGDDAELELSDSFHEGVVFSVKPPKKCRKNIANLLGGKKTLSSLSPVFALHHYKPTPLYVMDEIDSAPASGIICLNRRIQLLVFIKLIIAPRASALILQVYQ
ncbi:hypothetical protein L6164_007483 [Bauhinia variegata]|uniref:Uncharacterized protein n=1 Tax=Bauhinia variegata TaxID=167791 RepID=A0ACB9PDY2_BAUVA|nr:hypothetical protein L6164_007483 [Bauhinia variegata]